MSADDSLYIAKNEFIEADNGVRYAYRRFGKASETTPPLVCLQHFRGSMDSWDPEFIDPIAHGREVIVVDNTGVSLTSGTTPSTVQQMAADAFAFIDSLELPVVDLLGYSIGGFIAQEMVLTRPDRVRRLVLAGTGPAGAPGMHGWRADISEHARRDEPDASDFLYIFFAHTTGSRAAGEQVLRRLYGRSADRDAPTSLQTRDAQYDAIVQWGIPDLTKLQRLTAIRQPTLILQGDNDLMIPTFGSHTLAGLIPQARLVLFADAAHGSIFQYAAEAAAEINEFLDH
ncbi:alpha/beta fold hydrolase [Streptomyces sp. NPDC002962]|uniref:alpha/beta fold hydrolase n=1 Tax=Streptomyces sp. NPDC002962 TaxID=3364674 RepID=UPI0036CB0F8B